VEAAGIEPACRGTLAPTSTCVARFSWRPGLAAYLLFARPFPNEQGGGRTNQMCFLAVTASGVTLAGFWRQRARIDDQAVTSQAKLTDPGMRISTQPKQTAVQQF